MTKLSLDIELILKEVDTLDELLKEHGWTRRDEIIIYRTVDDREIRISIDTE